MTKYNTWTVVFNEQPSTAKWNLLGSNDSYLEDVATTGWTDANDVASETWSYASADSPTFTFTISADVTGKYQPGMRIRLKQGGAYKYFIITAVSYSAPNTTVTIYGGTDYTLANSAISDNYYSGQKAPFGFPLDPSKWTVTASDTTNRTQSSPSSGTWYNLGSLSIVIPIGIWRVYYEAAVDPVYTSSTVANQYTTLSNANNTESDTEFTSFGQIQGASGTMASYFQQRRDKTLVLAAKTTYYLNHKQDAGSQTSLNMRGDVAPVKLRAICAYL